MLFSVPAFPNKTTCLQCPAVASRRHTSTQCSSAVLHHKQTVNVSIHQQDCQWTSCEVNQVSICHVQQPPYNRASVS